MTPTEDASLFDMLCNAVPSGSVVRDVDLANLSRWRVGGIGRYLVEPETSREVAQVMALMTSRPEPCCVIGDTSNVLFDSSGFDGVLVRVGRRMSKYVIEGTRVHAEAGVAVPDLAWAVARGGLSGMEHTVGIPGTLGGLVLMNGGSQRKGIGENVVSAKCVNEKGDLIKLTKDQICFDYRNSALQEQHIAITEVELELERSDPAGIADEMIRILNSRKKKFPEQHANCGSTFVSNPALHSSVGPPGKAIEMAGLKGWRRGDAQISDLHANFILNTGNATSDDILWLISLIRDVVYKRTNKMLECEVRFISRDGHVRPAHCAALARWNNSPVLETQLM